jgi:hypothetical protein
VDLISTFREPHGIAAGTATNVCYHCGGHREVPLQQHLRPQELERTGSATQSVAFKPSGVVRRDLVIA